MLMSIFLHEDVNGTFRLRNYYFKLRSDRMTLNIPGRPYNRTGTGPKGNKAILVRIRLLKFEGTNLSLNHGRSLGS